MFWVVFFYFSTKKNNIWAEAWHFLQDFMCAQQRFGLACTSAQADQSLLCVDMQADLSLHYAHMQSCRKYWARLIGSSIHYNCLKSGSKTEPAQHVLLLYWNVWYPSYVQWTVFYAVFHFTGSIMVKTRNDDWLPVQYKYYWWLCLCEYVVLLSVGPVCKLLFLQHL